MVSITTPYEATLAGRRTFYNNYVNSGKYTPFLYPWDTLPAIYLFLGILIRPRLSRGAARVSGYVTFIAVATHSAYIISNRRSLGYAAGYGIGLMCAWGTIMTAVLLLFHEPERDFIRLEVREALPVTAAATGTEGVSHSAEKANGSTQTKKRTGKDSTQSSSTPRASKSSDQISNKYRLIWQPFPTSLYHSIDWAIDLMTAFRGVNWNFRSPTLPKIKTLPPPPKFKITPAIEATMLANDGHGPIRLSRAKHIRFFFDTAVRYLILDLLKAIMITDYYFLGLSDLNSNSSWPYLADHRHLIKPVRLLIAFAGVISPLSFIFSLSPLFFYTILPFLIPQSVLSHITKAPIYDPRFYTDQFQSFFPVVASKGLGGFWGRCWHQMFRYGITEPSVTITSAFKINPKSQTGRALQVVIAFALSGAIHASASKTTYSISPTNPWSPFAFFMYQAVGVLIQGAVARFLTKTMKLNVPLRLRQVVNLAYTVAWLYWTGPLFADDVAKGGIWLFEPVPISIFQGVMGQGWWRWGGGTWFRVWKGKHWWDTGIDAFS